MSIRSLFLVFILICAHSSLSIYAVVGTKKFLPNLLLSLANKTQNSAPEISLDQFKQLISEYTHNAVQELVSSPWLGKNPFNKSFLNNSGEHSVTPFAHKLTVPSGSKIAFFGDLHGNREALLKIIFHLQKQGYLDQDLHIAQQNFYMIFLGDYVDRGAHGVEVLSMLLALKSLNPNKIFLVRGNHEDRLLNTVYGFKQELKTKYPHITQDDLNDVFRVYDCMPSVLYLGSGDTHDFIQCCHGGMEIGYSPQALLSMPHQHAYHAIKSVARIEAVRELPSFLKQEVIKKIPQQEITNFEPLEPTKPCTLGFLWNDFIERPENYSSALIDYAQGRGWVFGKQLTAHLLTKQSSQNIRIRAVFRAHQHHGGMLKMLQQEKGIVTLWDGMVHTFLTAPLPKLDFSYVSLGILTTAADYKNWSLEHIVL